MVGGVHGSGRTTLGRDRAQRGDDVTVLVGPVLTSLSTEHGVTAGQSARRRSTRHALRGLHTFFRSCVATAIGRHHSTAQRRHASSDKVSEPVVHWHPDNDKTSSGRDAVRSDAPGPASGRDGRLARLCRRTSETRTVIVTQPGSARHALADASRAFAAPRPVSKAPCTVAGWSREVASPAKKSLPSQSAPNSALRSLRLVPTGLNE